MAYLGCGEPPRDVERKHVPATIVAAHVDNEMLGTLQVPGAALHRRVELLAHACIQYWWV